MSASEKFGLELTFSVAVAKSTLRSDITDVWTLSLTHWYVFEMGERAPSRDTVVSHITGRARNKYDDILSTGVNVGLSVAAVFGNTVVVDIR